MYINVTHMKTLNKKEWIAVVVSILVVLGFFVFNGTLLKNNQILPMAEVQLGEQIATKGSIVSVNYTGRLLTGEVFDSSADHGKPIQFMLGVGQVIQGWDEGIEGMKVGEKKTLTIPPEKGYGVNGYPPVIPPNATLIFDVELVGVQNPNK